MFFKILPTARTVIGVSLRAAVVIAMVIIGVLAEWLWWESYSVTVDWSKRSDPFPLPFYIVHVPHWFAVDLAILLITISIGVLAYMALRGCEKHESCCVCRCGQHGDRT